MGAEPHGTGLGLWRGKKRYLENSSLPNSLIIKGISNYWDNYIPKEIIKLDASMQWVRVNLNKIEQLQKPLEMTEIIDAYV